MAGKDPHVTANDSIAKASAESAALRARVATLKSESPEVGEDLDSAAQKAAAANLRQMGVDRSRLSRTIIGTYAVAVIAALIFIFSVTFMLAYGKCLDLTDPKCVDVVAAWKAQIELVQDLIVTAVLPIVTLMLGFYFGTESSRSRDDGNDGS